MNDDPKRPKYDPLFDDIFRGMFPAVPPKPQFHAPAGIPRPSPSEPLVIEIPLPKTTGDMIRKLLTEMQRSMPPPPPFGKHDAKLYDISQDEFGFQPVMDVRFGLDPMTKFLLVDPKATYPHRVLSIAHELGHAMRIKSGHLDFDRILKWNGPIGQHDPALCRYVQTEEVMAWRNGMRLLRKIGCRFSSTQAARSFREMCLSTYRLTTRMHAIQVRRLTVKE